MSSEVKEVILQLVRLGIGTETVSSFKFLVSSSNDWAMLKALADRQGLSAVVLDALNTDGTNLTDTMPVQMKLEWIGEVLQNYEQRYLAYVKAIESLARWYNQHGFKMMVLKGYACSLDWPKPEHRPCGDIDIWLFGKQKEADALLASSEFRVESLESAEKVKRIKIDSSHHHHTVFEWEGFTVENHYDFVNVHAHKSSKELEVVFKELGQDDSHFVEVNGESLYLPSANLHALFLVKHIVSHFAAAEITLRQVLDWAFFVEKHGMEIDWEWLDGILERYHMRDFYNCINAICVGDLGFKLVESLELRVKSQLKSKEFKQLKERVLNDILSPEWTAAEPRGRFRRLVYKYRRWQGNAWKQVMCYPESRWVSFFTGLWSHIKKPSV